MDPACQHGTAGDAMQRGKPQTAYSNRHSCPHEFSGFYKGLSGAGLIRLSFYLANIFSIRAFAVRTGKTAVTDATVDSVVLHMEM